MIRRTKTSPAAVIGYARVSTEEQAREGVSLANQRRRVRAHCAAQGLRLLRVEEDRGLSAKSTNGRPGLARALEALKAGEADGLVAVKLDRISRSIRDVISLVERARREGWRLISVGEQLDTDSAMGKFAVHLFGALAELERAQIGERTRSALGELRAQGKRISRFPPFGWRFVRNRLVPVPEERRVLRRMLRLREEGLGVLRIARRLGANPRTGKAWSPGSVYAILAREAPRRGHATLR